MSDGQQEGPDAVRLAMDARGIRWKRTNAVPFVAGDLVTWAQNVDPKRRAVFERDLGEPPYEVEFVTLQHSQVPLRGVCVRGAGKVQLEFPEDNFVLHEE